MELTYTESKCPHYKSNDGEMIEEMQNIATHVGS